MTLYSFLIQERAEILAASEKRVVALAALRPTSKLLQNGLPLFLDQLVEVLKKNLKSVGTQDEAEISDMASDHGRELLRLGYTLSHVVHSYGAMCQAITEVASAESAPVTAQEFHVLNRCLDVAIAGAVTEFECLRNLANRNREVVHLGAIAHELRNALNRARISYEMLSKGVVGLGGSTSRVLERSLKEMDVLINRSLSEVRLRADCDLDEEYFSISELVSQLVVTAEIEAAEKQQFLTVNVDETLYVKADRHLILAAIGNLMQNALKFTPPCGDIAVTAHLDGGYVVVSVQDQGGGIPLDKLPDLFKPFLQQNSDRSGLGLGLVIAKQATERCGGSLRVVNTADGCVFTVSLPRAELPLPIKPAVVV